MATSGTELRSDAGTPSPRGRVKYLIYEDDVTHKFAFFPLPNRFVDGDPIPTFVADRWFDSHDAAIAALPELFNRDDSEPDVPAETSGPVEHVGVQVESVRRH
jgi:hypothetical protein